jgi:glutamate carboxypeptidase
MAGMGEMTSTERDLIQRAAASPMLERTIAWAEENSGTRNVAGVNGLGAELADVFAILPGAVTLVDPAPVEAIDPDGRRIALDHGRHLLVTVRLDAPVQLLLTGHMDTVYPEDHPFQRVVRRDDATLHGPGVADMKGGLAVMLAALEAWEDGPDPARLGYSVLINSDEETGSLSSAALIAELARGRHAALTYEPALAGGGLAGARGGSGNFALVVRGRAAHAGRNPADGRNALVAAAELAVRLADARVPGLGVNPSRIDGGGPGNVVPDLAVLRVNFRPADSAAVASATDALRAAVAEVVAAREVEVEVHGGFNRPPKPLDAGAERLFALVEGCGRDLGLALTRTATGGVCDGNLIAAAGVPVVDTMGVRGGAIHSADEFMVIDSLAERAALSAITLARLAEGRW